MTAGNRNVMIGFENHFFFMQRGGMCQMNQIAAVAAVKMTGELRCKLGFKIAEDMGAFDHLLHTDDTGIMPGAFEI